MVTTRTSFNFHKFLILIAVYRWAFESRRRYSSAVTSSVSCCPNKCLKLSMEDIIYCEKSLKTEEQTNRRNLILDYLHKHSKPVTSGGIETKFFAGGKSVCKQAWLLAHDVKPDTFNGFTKNSVKV